MDIDHGSVVWFAKSFGLFYLIVLSLVVIVYAYWPANRKPFEKAAASILADEDKPWR